MKFFRLLCLTAFLGCEALSYAQLSPFTAVDWQEDHPQVQYEDQWYALRQIDDIKAAEMVRFCQDAYGAKWKKRFSEDLVQVMSEMGHFPGLQVNLVLEQEGQEKRVLAKMTEANRLLVWRYNKDKVLLKTLSRKEVEEDLAFLTQTIASAYSYADLKGVPYAAQLSEISQQWKEGGLGTELALEVGQVIAQFGDGHSRVRKLSRMLDPGFLPFAVSAYQNQVVCLSAEGAKLLHPQYPYLDAVNGLSVDSLLRLSRRFTADGSPQFVRFRSVELLAYIQFFLQLGEADQGSQLLVRLRNDQGKTKEIQTTLSEKPIWPPQLPAGDALLEENIGYLRLPSMSGSDPRLEKLPERMARFKDTRGLIIDVRGNGGGSRKALMTLAPYFLKPDQGPIVGNAAVFRTEDTSFPEEGYLSRRFMYPEKSGKYAPTALQAIATFKESFRPQWQFDEAQFSPWHYLVLSPQPETVPFLYEKPVVILMDAFCFSATDIFLAAMGEIAGITLMGTASGGGSGFSKTYELPHSGIEVSLSRMASFQPNGQMYDGVGVQPDIPISPDLEEVTGQRDGTLEEARAFILHQP